jgi:hypothetical protein
MYVCMYVYINLYRYTYIYIYMYIKSFSTTSSVCLNKDLKIYISANKSIIRIQYIGTLISKEEFDFHLESILAPRMNQLPESIKALAIDIRKSYENLLQTKISNETDINDQKNVTVPIVKSENEGDDYEEDFGEGKEGVEEKIVSKKTEKFSEFEKVYIYIYIFVYIYTYIYKYMHIHTHIG